MRLEKPFILVATVTVLLLAACSKDNDDEDKIPGILDRRASPALLPVPSCEDTADDGRFEIWNSSEDSLVLSARTLIRPVGLYEPGYRASIRPAPGPCRKSRSVPAHAVLPRAQDQTTA